jgi:hypothetical protein
MDEASALGKTEAFTQRLGVASDFQAMSGGVMMPGILVVPQ